MPKVSIGLPVYNGEQFLKQALDSILAQTLKDFDLLLYDNASTDGTEKICCEYAKTDSRIRYLRHKTNLGAGRNYNLTFLDSNSQYFKWAAHDDLIAPTFLERCVDVLDRNPSLVVVFPKMVDVDQYGVHMPERVTSHIARAERGSSLQTWQRFRRIIRTDYTIEEIFGVIRSDVLCKTKLFLNYSDSDRNLLAELALYGPLCEVPEILFYHRMHEGSSVKMYPTREERSAWFDPKLAKRITYPHNRQQWEYLAMLFNHPIGFTNRVFSLLFLGIHAAWRSGKLLTEIINGLRLTIQKTVKSSV